MYFQQLIVVGRLGGDPEMLYTKGGAPYTKFSIAYTEEWTTNDGQKHEKTTWFRATTFDKRTAENAAKFLQKGQEALVVGTVETSEWIDKDTKEARSALELKAFTIKFGSKAGQPSTDRHIDVNDPDAVEADRVASVLAGRLTEQEKADIPF